MENLKLAFVFLGFFPVVLITSIGVFRESEFAAILGAVVAGLLLATAAYWIYEAVIFEIKEAAKH